jgi:hypothetical protein
VLVILLGFSTDTELQPDPELERLTGSEKEFSPLLLNWKECGRIHIGNCRLTKNPG